MKRTAMVLVLVLTAWGQAWAQKSVHETRPLAGVTPTTMKEKVIETSIPGFKKITIKEREKAPIYGFYKRRDPGFLTTVIGGAQKGASDVLRLPVTLPKLLSAPPAKLEMKKRKGILK